jgi:hypothetical protein
MQTISWNWFWYMLIGFIVGGGSVYLWTLLREKTIKLIWYEWGLTVLGSVIFLFMGQTFIASFGEGVPRAAWMSLVFLGLPIIIIAVGTYRSVQSRISKSR